MRLSLLYKWIITFRQVFFGYFVNVFENAISRVDWGREIFNLTLCDLHS